MASNNRSVEENRRLAMSAQQYSFLIALLKRGVEDHCPVAIFLAHDNKYVLKNKRKVKSYFCLHSPTDKTGKKCFTWR